MILPCRRPAPPDANLVHLGAGYVGLGANHIRGTPGCQRPQNAPLARREINLAGAQTSGTPGPWAAVWRTGVNICFVNSTRKWGGVKSWTLDVAKGLAELGHNIVLLGRLGLIDKARVSGLRQESFFLARISTPC